MTAYFQQLHSIRRVQLVVYRELCFLRVYTTNRCVICFCILLLSRYKSVDITYDDWTFLHALSLFVKVRKYSKTRFAVTSVSRNYHLTH